MTALLTMIVLACPNTILIDKSGTGWNMEDNKHRAEAEVGCYRKYGEEFKCLKTFTKIEPNDYAAICGAPEEMK